MPGRNLYKELEEDMENGIPNYLKYISYFIKQVGFPIVAFLMIFYVSYIGLDRMTCAINANTKALLELSIISREFQTQVKQDHSTMQGKLDMALIQHNQ